MENNNNSLNKEVRKQISTYMTAAFGLVAALAWNDAIKSLIDYFVQKPKNTLLAAFIYAAAVTIILAIFSTYIAKYIHSGD